MLAQTEPWCSSDPGRTDAQAVLAAHGKSFHWAGRFLPRPVLKSAAVIYAVCRFVDDAVDTAENAAQARSAIESIRASLRFRNGSARVIGDFIEVADQYRLDRTLPRALIDGVESDIGAVRMPTRRDLLRYAYRVAGTVGAMMCPILGVRDPRAAAFAVDLGIAMQLTNIARDVLEDAYLDRLYRPQDGPAKGISCEALIRGVEDRRVLATRAVLDLLALAERYYKSADSGLAFLPLRSRIAILVASRVYRAIGRKIAKDPHLIWQGRTFVSSRRKAIQSAGAVCELIVKPSLRSFEPKALHEDELHTALRDLVPS